MIQTVHTTLRYLNFTSSNFGLPFYLIVNQFKHKSLGMHKLFIQLDKPGDTLTFYFQDKVKDFFTSV
jgi:hypothetical protein